MTAIFTLAPSPFFQETYTHTDVIKLNDGTFMAAFINQDTDGDDNGYGSGYLQQLNTDGAIVGGLFSVEAYVTLASGFNISGSAMEIERLDSGYFVVSFQSSDFDAVDPTFHNHNILFAADGLFVRETGPLHENNADTLVTRATSDAGFVTINIATDGTLALDKYTAFGGFAFGQDIAGFASQQDIEILSLPDTQIGVLRSLDNGSNTLRFDIIQTAYADTSTAAFGEVNLPNLARAIAAHVLTNGDILVGYFDGNAVKTRLIDGQTGNFGSQTVIQSANYPASEFSDLEFTTLADGTVLMRVETTNSGTQPQEHYVQKFSVSTGQTIGDPIPVALSGITGSESAQDTTSTTIGTDDGGFLIVGSGTSLGTGDVPFTVQTNWQGTITDDIEIMVEAGSFHAGEGNDFVQGSGEDDLIIGGNGSDNLQGGDGNDVLHGDDVVSFGIDSNFDLLSGGAGEDILINLAGDSRMSGGDGNDLITGGSAEDIVLGGNGNDIIESGSGRDTLDGGAGQDLIRAGVGDDWLVGGTGKDVLFGGQGSDLLEGGGLRDRLLGGQGDDVLIGGAGNDVLRGGTGNDTLTGGASADRFVFVGDGTLVGGFAEVDFISDFAQGEDRIQLDGITGATAFDDLIIESEGSLAVLYLTNREIVIGGTTAPLSEADFLFT